MDASSSGASVVKILLAVCVTNAVTRALLASKESMSSAQTAVLCSANCIERTTGSPDLGRQMRPMEGLKWSRRITARRLIRVAIGVYRVEIEVMDTKKIMADDDTGKATSFRERFKC